jgi:hypothetical protein
MDFDYFPDFSLLLAQSILKLHGGSVNVEHIDEKDTLCRVNISLRFRVKPIVE